jgi:hypothetical protein
MNTLDEAWRWYQSADRQVRLLKRLADRHWNELPWSGILGRDDRFRSLRAADLSEESNTILKPLDDLAVLVLFSVFEMLVRERVLRDMKPEAARLQHLALKHAVEEAEEGIAEGSFFRVLEPFKKLNPDLVEQVNQVRRYRNWVAHGRRGEHPFFVTPHSAYERLARFLALLDYAPPDWII